MTNSNAYNAGTNGKDGQSFIDEFLSKENSVIHSSDAVVLAMMKTEEIDVIIDEMIKPMLVDNPTIAIEDRGSYWWIKATGKIVIDCDEAAEILGKRYSVYDLLVNISTTIGRAMTVGNQFIITTELVGLESAVPTAL